MYDDADAKAKALQNSKPFDVHTWSDHPEVNAFIDPIYEEHFRSRKWRIEKKHLKVLLLDLYVTWSEDPTRKIAVFRDVGAYEAGTRYNELHISRLTIDVIDALIGAGLIDQAKGFYDRGRKRGKVTRIWPTLALVKMFKDARFIPLDVGYRKDRLTVILRDKDPKDKKSRNVEYEDDETTDQMSTMLAKYNDLLAATFIDIPTLEDRGIQTEDDDGKPMKHIVSQRDKFVRRIFNRSSFQCGGRFYGGWWQRCPKKWRPKIFMNDKPTNEIDFSGLHTVMLYAMEGIEYWKDVGEDPYLMPEFGFIDKPDQGRAVAKNLMLMLFNAKDSKSAYSAFRKKAEAGSPEKKLKNDQLCQIRAEIEKKHPAIAHHFGSDIGISLMNKDAEITEIILAQFMEWGMPALSIHDSYIVTAGHEKDLVEVMERAFEAVMGSKLVGYNHLAMKYQAEDIEDMEGVIDNWAVYGAPDNPWMPYEHLPWMKKYEDAFKERANPKRSERYKHQWDQFREWRRKKGGR